MLSIREATRHFGGLTAVSQVSFDVAKGEILGVIGPNGAGKTTFFNLVCGAIPLSGGSIAFDGHDITGLAPHRIAHLGIGRTFQIVRPFAELSVLDNVLAGMGASACKSFIGALQLCRREKYFERARKILASTRLLAVEKDIARNLPLGLLRRLEIARALALQPKLLLLDESFSGLSHKETESLSALVLDLRANGMTVLLIEHNMQITMNLCDRLVVLDRGQKIAEGTPDSIRSNERVVSAYLGVED
jgi:branched-chain amino acid transport system ATP-binding protein